MGGRAPSVQAAADHIEAGRLDQAIALLRRHVTRAPGDDEAQLLLGRALSRSGQDEQAIFYLGRAAAARPDDPSRWTALGVALMRGRGLGAAEAVLRSCPGAESPGVLALLAEIAERSHRGGEAVTLYNRVLAGNPADGSALRGLGRVLMSAGQTEEGLALIRRATRVSPGDLRSQAALCFHLNYSASATRAQVFEEHKGLYEMIEREVRPAPASRRVVERPARIGFVSADLRRHSVAYFLEPLLEHLDREAFKVLVFPTVAHPDAVTARLRAKADVWRDASGEDAAGMAAAIRAERPDVLIDLGGLTGPSRVIAMATRLAPIQATYLGYPNTSAVPNVDWRIVDHWTDPAEPMDDGTADRFVTERLMRMEGAFVCYRPEEAAPPVAPRNPDAPVTFGSFNAATKISPACLSLWARVLERVPGSRLVLKAASLGDVWVQDQFRGAFATSGISHDRIEFLGRTPSVSEHLNSYAQVDIALDTFPYNGTTTTCEAMWMGVPVVTLAGRSHASRVGLSLLTAAGLPENVAGSEAEFVARAAALAADRPALSAGRIRLREQIAKSMLCDGHGFARRFGTAIEQMRLADPPGQS